MAAADDAGENPLAPDEAFEVLGNEIRMEILQRLADAEDPLPFSELRDRVGVGDSGQFNYHLDKLVGHFVDDADEGYTLQTAGERVIEAVLSGAVTETPRVEPTRIDQSCFLCGAPMQVSFRQEWVAMACTECDGLYSASERAGAEVPPGRMEQGYLGGLTLPPAGVKGRPPEEILRAASAWTALNALGISSDICPRCSAPVNRTVRVCDDHDASEGLCRTCNRRHAVLFEDTCSNCLFTLGGAAVIGLVANTDLIAFQTTHGLNPIRLTPEAYSIMLGYDEEILSTEPLKARFTWTIDGDSLALTVNGGLSVIDVTKSRNSNPG